ncbi:hypothetical protein P43SY_001607 [Pythium insidiosum]|uniref:Amino acid permease/ SLC12A domain-containing protein n=1 Tax=Pythium insidiosum TaxID=114742 RepID=A0AAD5LM67_PYTIN|nr:hypothetical protein P43SY_001607 [Pythium insidiosum]
MPFSPRARAKLHVDNAMNDAPRGRQLDSMPVVELDAATDTLARRVYKPTKWDVLALGLSIGLGGQYFSWNTGLHAGLYSFMLDVLVIGMAYISLCCCTAEIAGALPFAGGSYGLSRCTLGYFPGYLIGCAEACEYIAYVSSAVMSLAKMIVESIPSLSGAEPFLWYLIYAHALLFHYRGDAWFWRWNKLMGGTSLLVVLLYTLGSLPHVDFAGHADTDPRFRFVDGVFGFVRALPSACWFFVGVEALTMASDEVLAPTTAVPFAQLGCMAVLFVVGVLVFFVTVSLPPPGLNQVSKLLAPFDNGFHVMFGVELTTATLFSTPAMYATTFGFMWGYGKLISAMATSKLLPSRLAVRSARYGTPIYALLAGSAVSYLLCLLVYFVPAVSAYIDVICFAAALLGYAGQCVGYIALKRLYPSVQSSTFHSPLGVYGAVYSLAVWLLGLLSLAGFQGDGGRRFLAFLVIIALLAVVYMLYARHHQTFSPEENKVFLVAHVMKLNLRKTTALEPVGARLSPAHVAPSHKPAPQDVLPMAAPPRDRERRPAPALGKTKMSPFHQYFSNPSLPIAADDDDVVPARDKDEEEDNGGDGDDRAEQATAVPTAGAWSTPE